jgi:hypothetical protein
VEPRTEHVRVLRLWGAVADPGRRGPPAQRCLSSVAFEHVHRDPTARERESRGQTGHAGTEHHHATRHLITPVYLIQMPRPCDGAIRPAHARIISNV